MALLALVAGQDVEPVEDSDGTDGRWRIAQRVAPDRVISTVDPDARHAHKTVHRRQDGFKAHLAVEPDTGLITDCTLTKASGADSHEAAVGLDLLRRRTRRAGRGARPTPPTAPAQARAELADAGHTAVIKPMPAARRRARRVHPRRLHRRQAAGTVTCPAGHDPPHHAARGP